MHEFSIIQSLYSQIEKYAAENHASQVLAVILEVGCLSGVEPHFLQVAFDTFKKGTVAENAKLTMEMQKIEILCRSCGKEATLEKNVFRCPFCKSFDVKVLKGEDLILKSLELESL